MSKGQLSSRIAEIHDMPKAYDNFIGKAKESGYTAAAYNYNQLYHMPTTYKIDQDSLTLHLFVHVPLVRDTEVMKMVQYKPTQIPVSNKYGINVKDKHDDVLAYNNKYFVTLKSAHCITLYTMVQSFDCMLHTSRLTLQTAHFTRHTAQTEQVPGN